MTPRGRERKKRHGRPRKAIEEAREFGALVEQEKKPGEKQARVFERVRRHDPLRWKSERTMFRLWKLYRADPGPLPQATAWRRKWLSKIPRPDPNKWQ